MRRCATRSAVARSRSTPASSEASTSTAWEAPWASACMSSASVIETPSKPSSSRSKSLMTRRDRVDGNARLPVSPGLAKCPDITIRTPASMAWRNGSSSVASSSARARSATASSWCVSEPVEPAPGKCLAVAATPADCSPAQPRRPEPADLRRIVAERADAHDRVLGPERDVEHRRVVDVHAGRPQLAPDRPPDPLGQVRVTRRPDRHRPGERRPAIAEGEELAALLVRRDEQRQPIRPGPAPRRPPGAPVVSRRSCAGERTLLPRNSVIPAAGVLASRSRSHSGTVLPRNASMSRPRISSRGSVIATSIDRLRSVGDERRARSRTGRTGGALPEGLLVGLRGVRVPDRGRRRGGWSRPFGVGHVRARAGRDRGRPVRRRGMRSLPPVPRGRCAHGRTRREGVPVQRQLAARAARWHRPHQRARPRVLRPPRRCAPGCRDQAARQPVPLGPAAAPPRSRRLRRPANRRLVRRIRHAGRVKTRRPGVRLDDHQRAGRRRVPRACRGHPRAGPARLADRASCRGQPAPCPRGGERGHSRERAGRTDRHLVRHEPGRARHGHGSRPPRRRTVERRARRLVPRSAVRPRLPAARPRDPPSRGPPGRRRADRPAAGRPRLPRPELLPTRPRQRPLGSRLRLDGRRRAGHGADADGLGGRAGRPARRPARRSTASTRHARSSSPRTAPRTRTPSIPTAASATIAGSRTWLATSRRQPTRSRPACPSPATTHGRCSTTTNGASATRAASASSTWTSRRSVGRPRTAPTGTGGSSPPP